MSPIQFPDAPALRRFMVLLFGLTPLLVGGAWLARGVDFALAALVGCLLVDVNFLWTRSVVRKAFLESNPRLWLGLSYGFRIGLTTLVLYIAIRELGLHPIGIALGVSALVLASLLYAVLAVAFPEKMGP